MPKFNWEDPFNEEEKKVQDPATWEPGKNLVPHDASGALLWAPGQPIKTRFLRSVARELHQAIIPPKLAAIRERQSGLLPTMAQFRASADEVLNKIKGDANRGGELLLKATEVELGVHVLFRMPDQPQILGRLSLFVMDHPVVLPVEHKKVAPALNRLFPTQFASETPIDPERKKAMVDGMKELGIVERVGLSLKPVNDTRMVVYPRLLNFTENWIKEVENPIYDLVYHERDKKAGFQRGFYVDGPPLLSPGIH